MTVVVLQPAAAAGIDTCLQAPNPTYNAATDTFMYCGPSAGATYRDLLKFDLSSIPYGATVSAASLKLRVMGEAGTTNYSIGVYRALTEWSETGSTWNLRNTVGSVPWGAVGGLSGTDYAASATDSTSITAPAAAYTWDVLADVAAWVTGAADNYGWFVINAEETPASNSNKWWASSDHATAGYRPELTITYTLDAYVYDVDYEGGAGHPAGCSNDDDDIVTLFPYKIAIADYALTWGNIDIKITGVLNRTPTFTLALADSGFTVTDSGTIEPYFSYDRTTWTAFDDSESASDGSDSTWQHNAAFENDTVYVALQRPTLPSDFATWVSTNTDHPFVGPTPSANASLVTATDPEVVIAQGRTIPATPRYGIKFSTGGTDKPIVVVHGICHASEMLGVGYLLAFMNWLIGDEEEAAYLLSLCDVYVYITGLQGIHGGLFRDDAQDTTSPRLDCNREWNEATGGLDSVTETMAAITSDTAGKTVAAFCDCHSMGANVTYWRPGFSTTNATIMQQASGVFFNRTGLGSTATTFNPFTGNSAGTAARWAEDTLGATLSVTMEVGVSRLYAPSMLYTPRLMGAVGILGALMGQPTSRRSFAARDALVNHAGTLECVYEGSHQGVMLDISGNAKHALSGGGSGVYTANTITDRVVDLTLVGGNPYRSCLGLPLLWYNEASKTTVPTSGPLTIEFVVSADPQTAGDNVAYIFRLTDDGWPLEATACIFSYTAADGYPSFYTSSTHAYTLDSTKDYRDGKPRVWNFVHDTVAGKWLAYCNGYLLWSVTSADNVGAYRLMWGGFAASRYIRIASALIISEALTASQIAERAAMHRQIFNLPEEADVRLGTDMGDGSTGTRAIHPRLLPLSGV